MQNFLRVGQVKSQLFVGELVYLLDDGTAQNLFSRQAPSSVLSAEFVTQIL